MNLDEFADKFEKKLAQMENARKVSALLLVKDHAELQLICDEGQKLTDQLNSELEELYNKCRDCRGFIWDQVNNYLIREKILKEEEMIINGKKIALMIEDGVLYKVE